MLNLTQPPFDDIHIRKAINWVVNKEALRKAWGGPFAGTVATHIAPDNMLADKLKGYAPYGSGKGDVAKAKAEVKLSKYDTNHDGICDAQGVQEHLLDQRRSFAWRRPCCRRSSRTSKSIGMTLKDRVLKDAYTPIGTVRLNTPFSTRPGWGKDYADPYAFFGANFDSRAITPTGNANRGLVGLTPALVKKFGVKGTVTGIPSVDKDLDNCQTKLEGARPVCYAALDKKLMTQVVPWVPYLWANYTNVISKNVTQWQFDQFSAVTAYAHVAVK